MFLEAALLLALIPCDIDSFRRLLPGIVVVIVIFGSTSLILSGLLSFAFQRAKTTGPIFQGILVACTWVVAEYIVYHVPVCLPFSLEVSISAYPIFIQSAKYCGALAIAWIILIVNYYLSSGDKKTRRLAMIVFCANLIFGVLALNLPQEHLKQMTVTVVQPDFSQKDFDLVSSSQFYENLNSKKLLALSYSASVNNPVMIIWPEASGNYFHDRNDLKASVGYYIGKNNCDLLAGTTLIERRSPAKEYNSAILINADRSIQTYRKIHLFPVFEKARFTQGKNIYPLRSNTSGTNIGTMICVESLFPAISRELAQKEAEVFAVLSSTVSLGNSSIPYLHAQTIALRAVENNRYAVHASNNGPSVIFDNKGRKIVSSEHGKTCFLTADIRLNNKKSFYTKYGDWFVFICFGIVVWFYLRSSTAAFLTKILPCLPA